MEAKFTHTEWQRTGTTVYALNLEGSNRFSALVQGGWATDGRLHTDFEELLANARLIAAAPRMYAYIKSRSDEGDRDASQILENINASF